MKKSNILAGSAALVSLIAVAGLAGSSFAAANNTTSSSSTDTSTISHRGGPGRGEGGMGNFKALTEEEKTAWQAKQDAVKAALEAGDYNAWVTAVKTINENSRELTEVTADNFSSYVEEHQAREAERADRQAKADAVKAALDAGDYNAWVTAVKTLDEDSSLLEKITADNFSRYAEAHDLRQQANTIMTELGLDGPGQGGDSCPGMGGGHGRPGGMGMGMGMGKMMAD